MLLSGEPHAMDILPIIPHVLCVYGQGLKKLKHHQYMRMAFIQATDQPSFLGPDLVRNAELGGHTAQNTLYSEIS